MRKEINYDLTTEEINEKYKHLFETFEPDENYDPERSYYKSGQVLRGYECGDESGWKRHVIDFLESLEWHRTHNLMIPNPKYDLSLTRKENEANGNPHQYIDGPEKVFKIFQIKEKFGQLRCYITAGDERGQITADKCLAKLEGLCDHTCELCGKMEYDLKPTQGWIKYLCSDCYKIYEEKHKEK